MSSNMGNAYMQTMFWLKELADTSSSMESQADIVAFGAYLKSIQSMLSETKRELQYRERSLDLVDYYDSKK